MRGVETIRRATTRREPTISTTSTSTMGMRESTEARATSMMEKGSPISITADTGTGTISEVTPSPITLSTQMKMC